MATLTLRLVKGSPLTNSEVDNNFSNLNVTKVEIGNDLGNTALYPQVIGLQGRPFANTAPASGQVIIWDSGISSWRPGNVTGGGGGGASVTVSDTPPGSPSAGDMWWKSDTGSLFIYYNDGDSSQWVEAAGGGGGTSLPIGGTTGQVLMKLSNTDYDASWRTPAASTGGGGESFHPFLLAGM